MTGRYSAACLTFLLLCLVAAGSTGAPGDTAKAAGLVLQPLPTEMLDKIQQATGYRVGVLITEVVTGSAVAKAGVQARDLLLGVGTTGVQSVEEADRALRGRSGTVKFTIARATAAGDFETRNLTMSLGPLPAAGGPGPPDIQAKLGALEAARQAGIMSAEEYARKKAELEALFRPSRAPDEASARKLKALEALYQAGLLTRQEYDLKRAEVEREARAAPVGIDPAIQQKLQAIATARDTGILTEDEAMSKMAEVLDGAGSAGRDDVTPVALTTYTDPAGRFQVGYPLGWEPQRQEQGVSFVRDGAFMNVLVMAGSGTAAALRNSLIDQFRTQYQDYREVRRGDCHVAGALDPFVEFTGVSPKGVRSRVQMVTHAVPGAGFVLLLITPEAEFAANEALWKGVRKSFKVGPAPSAPAGGPSSAPQPSGPAGGGGMG